MTSFEDLQKAVSKGSR